MTFSIEGGDPPVIVIGDALRIERVFINLLANALEATDGPGALKVTVGSSDGAATVRIEDNGRGMTPEEREKLFDPFFTTKDKGTGLGLAIVHNIIRRHGGQIRVESAPGAGTAFEIKLPQKGEAGGC